MSTKDTLIHIRLIDEPLSHQKIQAFLAFIFERSDMCTFSHPMHKSALKEGNLHVKVTKREKTYETHCTKGPRTMVYHLANTPETQGLFSGFKTLYDSIYLNMEGTYSVEDPAFYNQGKLLCSICSHEQIGRLILKESDYRIFRTLRIPHDTQDLVMQSSLDERIKEYAYQERTSFSLINAQLTILPASIGTLTSLQALDIHCFNLQSLPATLSCLTQLQRLVITGNQITELGFDLSKLQRLEYLDLTGVPLLSFPLEILKLPNLKKLFIGSLQNTSIPEELMQLKALEKLELPPLEEQDYSDGFLAFVNKRKPRYIPSIPLKDIIGEAKMKEMLASGHAIILPQPEC